MASLPTLYDFYTSSGINTGLSADNSSFSLNQKPITIYSGALHYFRVPRPYWRDRLKKLRAAGLNTVETYVPWNLHEPQPNRYDFGDGSTDFEEFLDLKEFLKIAQEEDLFAIVRPGPYICSEWDFGGMPSWLLRTGAKLRTSDAIFMGFVERYLQVLFKILTLLQFTKGGPIIAFQIENEYGNVKVDNEPIDVKYLEALRDIFLKNGVKELLFTSDTPSNGNHGSLPGILYTANFQNDTKKELDLLRGFQKDKAVMVMEFWSGWFDHWGEDHHEVSATSFAGELKNILDYPASVNFYMFHGGTNWGFLNGANVLDSRTDSSNLIFDTSSYDYDAPLTEAGDYTDKYYALKELIAGNKFALPKMPEESKKMVYPDVKMEEMIEASHFQGIKFQSRDVVNFEEFPINNNSGQSFGYAVYRKLVTLKNASILTIDGRVCDELMVLLDGKLVSKPIRKLEDFEGFGYWKSKESSMVLRGDGATMIELIVGNWGRNNFGKLDQFDQRKGLWQGNISLDGKVLKDWEIKPLEFKRDWIEGLKDWKAVEGVFEGPALYKGYLHIEELGDTWADMSEWKKGVLMVNGFVVSRFFGLGPQQTVYLPAPLLKRGRNEIVVFEHFQSPGRISFKNKPLYQRKELM